MFSVHTLPNIDGGSLADRGRKPVSQFQELFPFKPFYHKPIFYSSMSGPSLPSDVEQLPSSCCSLPPDVDENQELMDLDLNRQVSDSDAETLPESVTDSMDELPVPSEADVDMGDSPSPRALAKVPSPEEIRQWIRRGIDKAAAANLTLGLELYSPPRVLTACAARGSALSVCLTLGFLSFDILTGWNFDNPDQVLTVAFLYLSPPCTMFSSLQTMWNKHRMSQAVWDRRWQQAVDWVEH